MRQLYVLRLDGAGIADMHLGVTIEFGTRTRGSGFILPQNDGRGGAGCAWCWLVRAGGLRVVLAGTCGRAGRAARGGAAAVGANCDVAAAWQ